MTVGVKSWGCMVLIAAVAFAVVGCGGQEAEGPTGKSQRSDIRIAVVTHGQASDPFWSVVQNGVDQAAEDMGVEVEYNAPDTFDMVQMAQLIDTAVASDPDGLAVSVPDADALREPIQDAVDAGIPVVTLNSGDDVSAELGALAHVGQSERLAGVEAGERMAEAGVNNALCINQEVGNVALDLRCEGFEEGLGGEVEVIAVDLADPTGARAKIETAINQNPDANGMMALGPTGAAPAIQAREAAGKVDQVDLATFDLSPDVLKEVRDGNMLFAVDQQQYLQGYLPVVLLTQNVQYGLEPVGNVLTGPAFVTEENAGQVIKLSEKGIR